MPGIIRCGWSLKDPLMVAYHDEEWGVPVHDEEQLLGKLILDGAQAGLSWITILRKRESYLRAFQGFNAERIARYGNRDIERLMKDDSIVRNRQKIEAAIANAKAYLKLKDRDVNFDEFLWKFVGGKTKHNRWKTGTQVPAATAESEAMSKALRGEGFKFAGPTIVYAFMQAVGMVNDHLVDCFRHDELF
ncbi:MAG: DNA-3-methyladenine glycosylase I [Bacteroidota bacterium]|nr:DNA-3-methyladenine glycosylase I [Bacteroidota bacterium]MDP4233567.1 DNA-3-methyladenine glycosylase I [Bacteroidota bacterium]MDP4243659.1 DNA-3-methyladenine glycosylase I [Bacteroidota bacterium]MDP4287753.1 DNA-3-methyladenine glycosylase I [Bacteroidota bacterium]